MKEIESLETTRTQQEERSISDKVVLHDFHPSPRKFSRCLPLTLKNVVPHGNLRWNVVLHDILRTRTRKRDGNAGNVVWHDILPFYTTFLEGTVYISRLCIRSGGFDFIFFSVLSRVDERSHTETSADQTNESNIDSINFN